MKSDYSFTFRFCLGSQNMTEYMALFTLGIKNAFWSIGSQVDNEDTYPFTPGLHCFPKQNKKMFIFNVFY